MSDSAGIWSSADMRDDFLFLTLSSKDPGSAFACFAEKSACIEILNGVRWEKVLSRKFFSLLNLSGKGGNPGKPNFASWSVGAFSHPSSFEKTTHAQVDETSCIS